MCYDCYITLSMWKQQEEYIKELTSRLAIEEKEITKLKEDKRLLLKSRSRSKESKESDIKADEVKYCMQSYIFALHLHTTNA